MRKLNYLHVGLIALLMVPFTASAQIKMGYIDSNRIMAEYEEMGHVRDFDLELARVDGSSLWAIVNMEPTVYGGAPARIVWNHDITERKRAEEELREQT